MSRFIHVICLVLVGCWGGLGQAAIPCPRAQLCSDPVLNPDNGHYYVRVDYFNWPESGRGWSQAEGFASSMTYLEMPGYLATITSASEQLFVDASFSNRVHSWIGASDAAVEGDWRWMAGPEAGQLFWSQGSAIGYANWTNGKPDDLPREEGLGEDFAIYNWFASRQWNDLPEASHNDAVNGYLVEFSPVPEPSGIALAALGGIALCVAGRKFRVSNVR